MRRDKEEIHPLKGGRQLIPEFQGKAALHSSTSGGCWVHGHSSSAEEWRLRPPPEKGHVGFPGRLGGPRGSAHQLAAWTKLWDLVWSVLK